MQELTPEGRRMVESVAQRHGVSTDAALTLVRAIAAGHGTMAQFSHPELGGMGQWTQGGMTMVGNMFDQGLRARVDALCSELASLLRSQPVLIGASPTQSDSQSQSDSAPDVSLFAPATNSPLERWWPAELGSPSASGAQNDLRYAFFPAAHRLAIQQGGRVTVYDTGGHLISGVSQQQSGGQSLAFKSQHGLVRLAELPVIEASSPSPERHFDQPSPQPTPTAPSRVDAPVSPPTSMSSEDVFGAIERLAELHRKGILTEEEFTAKKADLLSRI
jgi:hypothetical protein